MAAMITLQTLNYTVTLHKQFLVIPQKLMTPTTSSNYGIDDKKGNFAHSFSNSMALAGMNTFR